MNANWRAFWVGVGAAIAAAGGILAAILMGKWNRRGENIPKTIPTPQEIKNKAEVEIKQIKAEIKSDSDQALADRFNRLAEKQKGKNT